jgi:hypothetical protein
VCLLPYPPGTCLFIFLLLLRNHDTNSKIEKLSADRCRNLLLSSLWYNVFDIRVI